MIKRLILIGDLDIIDDFGTIFSHDGKYLISRTFGSNYCFEMSGESMYYALLEKEQNDNISLKEYKQKIVNAILLRLLDGNGILTHKSFSGGSDTQFRSTNSAIRTLLAAKNDGFNVDEAIYQILNFHFSYYFEWMNGIWFCHDSSELDGKIPLSHIQIRLLNKHRRNTLTLNTHIDSINTLLLLKKYHFNSSLSIDDLLYKSIISINQLLFVKDNKIGRLLQKIDNLLLDRYVEQIWKHDKWLFSIYERLIHPIIFKVFFPTIFFQNGFIARDLSVLNRHLDYILTNIVDFTRMLCLYNDVKSPNINVLECNIIENKIKNAVKWVESHPHFIEFINNHSLLSAWYAEMYYALSNLDQSYIEKANTLSQTGMFCTYSPFYKSIF